MDWVTFKAEYYYVHIKAYHEHKITVDHQTTLPINMQVHLRLKR